MENIPCKDCLILSRCKSIFYKVMIEHDRDGLSYKDQSEKALVILYNRCILIRDYLLKYKRLESVPIEFLKDMGFINGLYYRNIIEFMIREYGEN